MSGEHPLKRKLRDQAQQSKQATEQAKREQQRIAAERARSAAEWPKDEAALRQAIEASNKVLQDEGLNQKYKYEALPQPGGYLARSHIQLHDGQTASTVYLDIGVTHDGRVTMIDRQTGQALDYAVGQVNVASWNDALSQLYDRLKR